MKPKVWAARVVAAAVLSAIVLVAVNSQSRLAEYATTDSMSVKDKAMSANLGTDFAKGMALGAVGRRDAVVATAAPPLARPEAAAHAQEPPAFTRSSVVPTMVIRTASVTVQVDSLDRAVTAVRQIATSLGGYIANMNAQTGEHQVRSATLVMKIPPARFDSALLGMPALGKVESSGSHLHDVGEEFVDVNARMANARRLESRLITLLATRTGKLQDVLTVERELARVRQEIERYQGRIQYLGTQVAMSTIDVTVHEKFPIVATQPGTNPIRVAFVNMWRNAVRFTAMGIESLGVLIPVALLAWIGFAIWKRVRPLAAG